ncbi:hypothetical protein SAMN05444320_107282 [Streptoalloteichus hindustanus]|uniref:Uncharacterized protein n=1 Tax=Streptoalloteichus hindustanus TaxID=2017 RepID=A0A1M5II65_STRHI|nr:hypothetical protein SAMN05444320_107282 [Streptoalloteichus hindustanus]
MRRLSTEGQEAASADSTWVGSSAVAVMGRGGRRTHARSGFPVLSGDTNGT